LPAEGRVTLRHGKKRGDFKGSKTESALKIVVSGSDESHKEADRDKIS